MTLRLWPALLFLSLYASADQTASPNVDSFFHVPSQPGLRQVEKELECIQSKTPEKLAFIHQHQASEMIKVIAPALQDAVKEWNLGPQERALFYSQVIEESGGFTQLSESTLYYHAGNDPIAQLTNADANDRNFKGKRKEAPGEKKLAKSREFGAFRGRGLIQITGCSNFFSVVHYLNLVYAGKPGKWVSDWKYYDAAGEKQTVDAVCNPKQLASALNTYQEKYRQSANLYGALEEPMRFAMIGAELTDPMSKKKISSERFMVDASLAYWRGRCGELITQMVSPKGIKGYAPCASFASSEYLDQAAKCLTHCIKGKTEGWDARRDWLKKAMLCTY